MCPHDSHQAEWYCTNSYYTCFTCIEHFMHYFITNTVKSMLCANEMQCSIITYEDVTSWMNSTSSSCC